MDYILRGRSKADEKLLSDRYITDFKKTVLDQMKSYDDFANRSIESIDVYGLGMSLQFILAYTKRFMESGIVKELDECFFRMTTANLSERYTVNEAVDAFETALETAGYAAFENNERVSMEKSKTTEKSLKKIQTSDISIHKLTKNQLRRAMNRFS